MTVAFNIEINLYNNIVTIFTLFKNLQLLINKDNNLLIVFTCT